MDKPSGVYDPEDLANLGNLFDRAIAFLPICMRTSENRVAIARLVMQRAARDELASLANLMLHLSRPLDQLHELSPPGGSQQETII